jgi:hypothetical protein
LSGYLFNSRSLLSIWTPTTAHVIINISSGKAKGCKGLQLNVLDLNVHMMIEFKMIMQKEIIWILISIYC